MGLGLRGRVNSKMKGRARGTQKRGVREPRREGPGTPGSGVGGPGNLVAGGIREPRGREETQIGSGAQRWAAGRLVKGAESEDKRLHPKRKVSNRTSKRNRADSENKELDITPGERHPDTEGALQGSKRKTSRVVTEH